MPRHLGPGYSFIPRPTLAVADGLHHRYGSPRTQNRGGGGGGGGTHMPGTPARPSRVHDGIAKQPVTEIVTIRQNRANRDTERESITVMVQKHPNTS